MVMCRGGAEVVQGRFRGGAGAMCGGMVLGRLDWNGALTEQERCSVGAGAVLERRLDTTGSRSSVCYDGANAEHAR